MTRLRLQVDYVVDVFDADRAFALTQAPQVTQSQTTSSVTALGTTASG